MIMLHLHNLFIFSLDSLFIYFSLNKPSLSFLENRTKDFNRIEPLLWGGGGGAKGIIPFKKKKKKKGE